MEHHNRIANMQVVFVDVEKYSRRRTLTQIQVIDALTECFKKALAAVSQSYIGYAQANSLNFQTDIIKLPTGDGAAIIFTFDGLHDVHLSFAKQLLQAVYQFNGQHPCEKFALEGWCNCHANFNICIGLSEGKGIVFKDLNGSFNVAGGVINMAGRMMSIADRNQIVFTEEGYRQIVDMVDDPGLGDHFVQFADAKIKHGLKLNVYQYVDESLPFLNSRPPEDLLLSRMAAGTLKKMRATGFNLPFDQGLSKPGDRKAMLQQMEQLADVLLKAQGVFSAIGEPRLDVEAIPLPDGTKS
jgi:hypothetical protein